MDLVFGSAEGVEFRGHRTDLTRHRLFFSAMVANAGCSEGSITKFFAEMIDGERETVVN